MNKLFLVCLAFALAAVAYGQPTEEFNLKALAKLPKEQRQCAANKFMLNKLAGLNSKDGKYLHSNQGPSKFTISDLAFKLGRYLLFDYQI